MKNVTVQYIYEGICDESENEIGVYFPEAGQVLAADSNGLVSIYNCVQTDRPDVVQVIDRHDFAEDAPEYIVSLIIGV